MVFQKGQSVNPSGKVGRATRELLDVLKEVGEVKGKTFIKHFVERAYSEDAVAIALAKKILPDLTNDVGGADRIMQLIVDSKDIPAGSLTAGGNREGKAPTVPD